ncbi:MAG: DUF885 domain-containing protein, partial [Candidatus Krumholzibacteria bacterium]|nr:DUF885 domain-containing protein [Candidatus Krumholzibacteria bacterium]
RNHVELSIFRLETLREHEWNPLVYNIGGAIYSLIARDFAPIEDRMGSVLERLRGVPEVAALAKANLTKPPRVHTETAIQQNRGTINLIRDQLAELLEEIPDISPEFEKVQASAVDALEYYGSWLENDLLQESDADFRLGENKFRRKLEYVLHSDLTMGDILARAERDLLETQAEMHEVALPLYQRFSAAQDGDVSSDKEYVIKFVLDRLAESRPANETIVGQADSCLTRCIDFARSQRLVSVPDEPLELIVMPEFQRGVAVAYCDAPGPLEPEGKTFFAISPTPADWTQERVASFFREYNNYMLHDLTIHEAVPGHYLQINHSNRFQAPTMVRSIFYSGPFVEGWATYAEQLMAEAGYGGPEVKMQYLKMRLRMIINAIIDNKIHTQGMTEGEAKALMMKHGFQEEGEASGKWRRACLTSTQLSTYYVGNIEVNDIRRAYERNKGSEVALQEMHDEMLSFGSPPPKYVRQLMGL